MYDIIVGRLSRILSSGNVISTGVEIGLNRFSDYVYRNGDVLTSLDKIFTPISYESLSNNAQISLYDPPVINFRHTGVGGGYRYFHKHTGSLYAHNVGLTSYIQSGENYYDINKRLYLNSGVDSNPNFIGLKGPVILSGWGKDYYNPTGTVGEPNNPKSWKTGPAIFSESADGLSIADRQNFRTQNIQGDSFQCMKRDNRSMTIYRVEHDSFNQNVPNSDFWLYHYEDCKWSSDDLFIQSFGPNSGNYPRIPVQRLWVSNSGDIPETSNLNTRISGIYCNADLEIFSKTKGGVEFSQAVLTFTAYSGEGNLSGIQWKYTSSDPWIGDKTNTVYLSEYDRLNGLLSPMTVLDIVPGNCFPCDASFPSSYTVDFSIPALAVYGEDCILEANPSCCTRSHFGGCCIGRAPERVAFVTGVPGYHLLEGSFVVDKNETRPYHCKHTLSPPYPTGYTIDLITGLPVPITLSGWYDIGSYDSASKYVRQLDPVPGLPETTGAGGMPACYFCPVEIISSGGTYSFFGRVSVDVTKCPINTSGSMSVSIDFNMRADKFEIAYDPYYSQVCSIEDRYFLPESMAGFSSSNVNFKISGFHDDWHNGVNSYTAYLPIKIPIPSAYGGTGNYVDAPSGVVTISW